MTYQRKKKIYRIWLALTLTFCLAALLVLAYFCYFPLIGLSDVVRLATRGIPGRLYALHYFFYTCFGILTALIFFGGVYGYFILRKKHCWVDLIYPLLTFLLLVALWIAF